MNTTAWVYCPVCGNKTRTMIREDTEMKNSRSTVRSAKKKQSSMSKIWKSHLQNTNRISYVYRRYG